MIDIRNEYAQYGVEAYYKNNGNNYRNPHESIIGECLSQVIDEYDKRGTNILDLACGSGEVTSCFKNASLMGVDPYTHQAYFRRTGKYALPYTFDDIANGVLKCHYDIVICSFAMHLIEKSRLPGICAGLSQITSKLIILTPNKNPIINFIWELKKEILHKRVRLRIYELSNT